MTSPETSQYPDLTQEQIEMLQDGPGLVQHAADLIPVYELSGLNNFHFYFRDCQLSDIAYRNQPFYKRFEIIYPDVNLDLLIKAKLTPDDRLDIDLEAELRNAYELMSKLVDTEDPYVMKNGQVDRYILIR